MDKRREGISQDGTLLLGPTGSSTLRGWEERRHWCATPPRFPEKLGEEGLPISSLLSLSLSLSQN